MNLNILTLSYEKSYMLFIKIYSNAVEIYYFNSYYFNYFNLIIASMQVKSIPLLCEIVFNIKFEYILYINVYIYMYNCTHTHNIHSNIINCYIALASS